MNREELASTAKALAASGKGLLAKDQSNRTCNKRFEEVGIAPTEENRGVYRELILTAHGLGNSISVRRWKWQSRPWLLQGVCTHT
jgi:fructose-bisphosphate aldolase, class I